MTFLAALRQDRVEVPWLIDWPINGERFHLYVEKRPQPRGRRRLLLAQGRGVGALRAVPPAERRRGRGLDEIALAELATLAHEVAKAVDDRDSLPVAMGRAIDLRRLHETTRERSVSACRASGLVVPDAPR